VAPVRLLASVVAVLGITEGALTAQTSGEAVYRARCAGCPAHRPR
jgi:hypothetical protein